MTKELGKNKMVNEAPKRDGLIAFMFPANSQYSKTVTVWAKTKEEAEAEYKKIINNK